ncbi:von Willebrand factor type A domain-containing protein [Luteolibacter sp. SL250]|uniref:VWA domain-containing protein n=1 Tax=Luteolibacter sp. SL250 TaxID=2995170 RepID=UPI00226DFBEF|nr:von Willebrand factor type A domain-containing protein [Luteolibacter sp. SL250]WAC18149.1 von Willebrand factor type A domain-containing protein [Luteolibacter sp. SL250]
MKLHPDDPRITAYVLGELTPEDAAAVEAAAENDPAVKAAIEEAGSFGGILSDALVSEKPKLRPAQRQAILLAAREPEKITNLVKIPDARPNRRSWIVSLAAAALLLFAFVLFSRAPVFSPKLADRDVTRPPRPTTVPSPTAAEGEEEWRTIPINIAMLPAPGPVDASQVGRTFAGAAAPASTISRLAAARDEAIARAGSKFYDEAADSLKDKPVPADDELPPLSRRGSVAAAASPQMRLPIRAGSASMIWVTESIRKEHKKPPVNAIRVEEILNHYPLRPAGAASVAQGVTLSTEALPCPWKPSASLLIIAFRGANDGDRQIQANFKADPSTVARYRLLGYSPVAGIPDGSLPTLLPAKALTLVAIEIEPTGSSTDFGTVEWSVNEKPAPPIALSRKPDAEPSDDARFASLLCTYAQWLAGDDQAGMIDSEVVAALAREMASDNLPPDRYDLLNLIDQTLNL